MRCKGRLRGEGAWHSVDFHFASASNCDLLSDDLAEELGVVLRPLFGCFGGDLGWCQIACNVQLQLETEDGHYVRCNVPVMVVPTEAFCQYRKVVLGLPFLKRQGAIMDCHTQSIFLQHRRAHIKLASGNDHEIPRGVNVTGYFCCSRELNKACLGEADTGGLTIEYSSMLNKQVATQLNCHFRNLLDSLELLESDFEELREQRGLSMKEVRKACFKTWPGGPMLLPAMKSDTEIEFVQPVVRPAILIPAHGTDGLITAIHTKPHRVEGDENIPKYMWASLNRSFKLCPATPASEEYDECPEPEDPLFVCMANKSDHDSIALIEGGLKAYVFACQMKARLGHGWVIGAAGGQFWQSPEGFMSAFEGTQPGKVVLYPDAGAVENPHVLLAYFRSLHMLQAYDVAVTIAWWGQRSKDNHLDADDFLHRGGSFSQMRQISVQDFWRQVPPSIQRTIFSSNHEDLFRSVLNHQYDTD